MCFIHTARPLMARRVASSLSLTVDISPTWNRYVTIRYTWKYGMSTTVRNQKGIFREARYVGFKYMPEGRVICSVSVKPGPKIGSVCWKTRGRSVGWRGKREQEGGRKRSSTTTMAGPFPPPPPVPSSNIEPSITPSPFILGSPMSPHLIPSPDEETVRHQCTPVGIYKRRDSHVNASPKSRLACANPKPPK